MILNIRQVIIDNVCKIINCKTGNLGFHIFKCPKCNKILTGACTCKSRIYSSCGNKYNKQRPTSILSKIYNWRNYFDDDEKLYIFKCYK